MSGVQSTGCPKKKGDLCSGLIFRGLNGLKSKSGRKPTLEFNFTYWDEFSALYMACIAPVYDLYTNCIHYAILDNCTELNIKQVHNTFSQS